MKTIHKTGLAAANKSLVVGSLVIAAIANAPMASAEVNFRGFGSIVAGQTVSTSDDQSIMGYNDTFAFRQDSLFALQMDADLDEGLSATMQLMSRGKNDYDVNVEWAYLTYEIQDGLKISAGHIRAPFYRYSDFLDVHYALNWVTAPDRVYTFNFPSMDGLSLLHNTTFGSVDSALQIVYGNTNGDTNGTPLKLKNQLGVSWIGSWEWLSVRASYLQSDKVELDSADLENTATLMKTLGTGMAGVGAGFGQVATFQPYFEPFAKAYSDASILILDASDNVTVNDDKGFYTGAGFSIDKDHLVIDSEITYYELENAMIPKTTSYYMTLGWRFGPTLVYTTYSREQADSPYAITNNITDLTLMAAALAPYQNVPELAALVGGATQLADGAMQLREGLLGTEQDLVNWNIGMRWDFHPSAAFKVAYENHKNRITDKDGSVVRAAIDLVF